MEDAEDSTDFLDVLLACVCGGRGKRQFKNGNIGFYFIFSDKNVKYFQHAIKSRCMAQGVLPGPDPFSGGHQAGRRHHDRTTCRLHAPLRVVFADSIPTRTEGVQTMRRVLQEIPYDDVEFVWISPAPPPYPLQYHAWAGSRF